MQPQVRPQANADLVVHILRDGGAPGVLAVRVRGKELAADSAPCCIVATAGRRASLRIVLGAAAGLAIGYALALDATGDQATTCAAQAGWE